MKEKIIEYYSELAQNYDENRFSNSYGNYIDDQENNVVSQYLDKANIDRNLDIACGTGRFLEYANYGLDISPNMVDVALGKFPNKQITVGDAEALPFEKHSFKNVLSFHLFMHLGNPQIKNILEETARVCEQDGCFIFDVPSKKRRALTGYKASSWHGGHQMDARDLEEMASDHWDLVSYHGIAFFPIHRIPKSLRKLFIRLDNWLCNSVFKEFSSHLIFILKKK